MEVLAFAKQRKPFQVQFGIPVFTGILMAVYRYSVFAISIHSTFNVLVGNEKAVLRTRCAPNISGVQLSVLAHKSVQQSS